MAYFVVILSTYLCLIASPQAFAHDSGARWSTPASRSCEALLDGPLTPKEADVFRKVERIESFWQEKFAQRRLNYRSVNVITFKGSYMAPFGYATTQGGPVYSLADETIYVDPFSFEFLSPQIGPSTDAGLTAIIAHEMGHHVQKVLGAFERATEHVFQENMKTSEVSIGMELQADCLAGMYMGYLYRKGFASRDHIEETVQRFSILGDDVVEGQDKPVVKAAGHIWIHPDAKERAKWLERGVNASSLDECETFEVPLLL